MSRIKPISPKSDARHARGHEAAPLRVREKAVPVSSRWDEALGPFYSASQAARICGGASNLEDSRQHRAVLGLTTADGIVVYPVFQFDEQSRVLNGLPEVLKCFSAGYVDDWALVGWLVSPLRGLDGLSVIQWLRDGRDLAPALVLARDAAHRFAQ